MCFEKYFCMHRHTFCIHIILLADICIVLTMLSILRLACEAEHNLDIATGLYYGALVVLWTFVLPVQYYYYI